MPPPGCPIPEWVYPGRVLASRHNVGRYVWVDSIRYTEAGDFYISLRQVLSLTPMVVNRFCVTEAWAIGFQRTYAPTEQWEPYPSFEWDEELRQQFLDDDQTCEIELRDGSRTWNIESMGVEGSRMTMGVSRDIAQDEAPDGEMEAVEEPYRQQLPHLMMPSAVTIPLDDPMSEEEQADLNAMLDQAEVDPDMRVFTQRPLEGFQRVTAHLPQNTVPEGVNAVSMGTIVPYSMEHGFDPLWPAWLPQPPQDGNHWVLRVQRDNSILAHPDFFRPQDVLIWFRDPELAVQVIGTVDVHSDDRTEPVNVPITLFEGSQVVVSSEILRRIMPIVMPAVHPDPIPSVPVFIPGQLVSIRGGNNDPIGVVITSTPRGVQVQLLNNSTIVEFERDALETHAPPSDEPPTVGSFVRAPNGRAIGHVTRVVGTEVTWATGDNRSYVNNIDNLRAQGATFEAPNRALTSDTRVRRPASREPKKLPPTLYERILKDDD